MRTMTDAEKRTLAQWWCRLNKWQSLPSEDELQAQWEAGNRATIHLMNLIKGAVGEKFVSREWNEEMTDEQHEE